MINIFLLYSPFAAYHRSNQSIKRVNSLSCHHDSRAAEGSLMACLVACSNNKPNVIHRVGNA